MSQYAIEIANCKLRPFLIFVDFSKVVAGFSATAWNYRISIELS
jgi:hypothetical protein